MCQACIGSPSVRAVLAVRPHESSGRGNVASVQLAGRRRCEASPVHRQPLPVRRLWLGGRPVLLPPLSLSRRRCSRAGSPEVASNARTSAAWCRSAECARRRPSGSAVRAQGTAASAARQAAGCRVGRRPSVGQPFGQTRDVHHTQQIAPSTGLVSFTHPVSLHSGQGRDGRGRRRSGSVMSSLLAGCCPIPRAADQPRAHVPQPRRYALPRSPADTAPGGS